MLRAWLTYFKERFPLIVYTLIVGGFAASGTLIGGGRLGGRSFWLSFLGLMFFFAVLRTMDEVKDYEKDRIANPTRPLPRGVLPIDTVKRTIAVAAFLMIAFAFALFPLSAPACAVYLFLTVHLWLMYREFYVGPWLEDRQLLYAISHQLVLIWVAIFPAAAADPLALKNPTIWLYALLVLGSFFSYEVCRKLDPRAHPILHTYRALYGAVGCFAIVSATCALAIAAAGKLGMAVMLWPLSFGVLLSFSFLPLNRHKVVETVASLSLVIHLWSVAIARAASFLGWL